MGHLTHILACPLLAGVIELNYSVGMGLASIWFHNVISEPDGGQPHPY
jgi:hypothetical protein